MHTVELLEQAIEVAQQLGYGTRQEWLGGHGGGACEFAGKRWIFVDLALNVVEQLDQVVEALRHDAHIHNLALSREMQQLLDIRKAA